MVAVGTEIASMRTRRELPKEDAIKQRMEQLGAVVAPSTSEGLASILATELDKWGRVIKEGNIKPE